MMRDGIPSIYTLALLGLTALLALAAGAVAGLPDVERIELSDAIDWLRAPSASLR